MLCAFKVQLSGYCRCVAKMCLLCLLIHQLPGKKDLFIDADLMSPLDRIANVTTLKVGVIKSGFTFIHLANTFKQNDQVWMINGRAQLPYTNNHWFWTFVGKKNNKKNMIVCNRLPHINVIMPLMNPHDGLSPDIVIVKLLIIVHLIFFS